MNRCASWFWDILSSLSSSIFSLSNFYFSFKENILSSTEEIGFNHCHECRLREKTTDQIIQTLTSTWVQKKRVYTFVE